MTAPEDLQRAILGEQPRLTSTEVAARAEVPEDHAHRLWRALGFPDAGESAAFSEADVVALRSAYAAVAVGALDLDTVVRLTRAVGQTFAKLAEWEVATLVPVVERAHEQGMSRTEAAAQLVESVGSAFESVLIYSWRRHLAAAITRAESLVEDEEEAHIAEATVGFADLVSFSALTNDLNQQAIGDLVELFETRSHDIVAQNGGRVIKTLGDSVLFVAPTPAVGVDIGWDIIQVIGRDDRLPDVHVGVVTGPVVSRMGDVYGPAVNLAARLTGVARRNRVIIDKHTAALLPPAEYESRVLPARPLRGFGDLEPVAVRRTRSR